MYPQTHVYFTEKVFGTLSPALTLGSVFPDIAVAICPDRQDSHGRGIELLAYMRESKDLFNFALGVITHGINPKGLDYYGDEKYLNFERGYCFEKSRPLIEETIRACNLPPEMGWWKAHNIIEMGVELRISNSGPYSEALKSTFTNTELINKVSENVARFYLTKPFYFRRRIYNFSHYIETSRATAESLARRYDIQMFTKHRIHIDIPRVSYLISQAAEIVSEDIDGFFKYVLGKILKDLSEILTLD